MVDRIYGVMTGRPDRSVDLPATPVPAPVTPGRIHSPMPASTAAGDSPNCIAAFDDPAGLGETATDLGLEVDDLLPLVDVLETPGFAYGHPRAPRPHRRAAAGTCVHR